MTAKRKTGESDFEWSLRHSLKLQEKYEGKWVAILDEEIIGVGETAKEAYESAKKEKPDRKPLLTQIPTKELLVL